MIEAIKTGKRVSIEEYQLLTENDPEFQAQVKVANREYRKTVPKVYRNGTGKGYWAKQRQETVDPDQQINEAGFHPNDLLDGKQLDELAESNDTR